MDLMNIAPSTCIVRNTAAAKGRTLAVLPGTTAARHLRYGRIILDAAPGGATNFLWMMAANREDEDRQYGVVNVHPDFAAMGSGLDTGRAEQKWAAANR